MDAVIIRAVRRLSAVTPDCVADTTARTPPPIGVGKVSSPGSALDPPVVSISPMTRRVPPGPTADTASRNAALGAQDDLSEISFLGILDEVRISNVARSDAWIALDHLSQQAPGIVTVGAIEVAP